MHELVTTLAVVTAATLAAGLALTWLPLLGRPGRALAGALAQAPLLDVVVFTLTLGPWVGSVVWAGWGALPVAIAGQLIGLYLWVGVHEATRRDAARGPRIIRFINAAVGRVRNHAALLATLVALPAFLTIRVVQALGYPPLVWLLKFPRYRQREWVNVSRQKFDGLVGHDLIWCLYCDWMTGVYALGAEMLRNVESFWCPIRFSNPQKCANCRVDFPDIDNGWAPADAGMGDVVRVLEKHYAEGRREWFGHPARLTVEGEAVEADAGAAPEK